MNNTQFFSQFNIVHFLRCIGDMSIGLMLCIPLFSQTTSQEDLQNLPIQFIEEYIESLEGNEDFDYNTLFEDLLHYFQHPLNINTADYDDLKSLFILNDLQIDDILRHRQIVGPFLNLYELQSVESISLKTLRLLIPFIHVADHSDDFQYSISNMLSDADAEIFLKWKRILEEQKGYVKDDVGSKAYSGDPNRIYLRYRLQYSNRLKIGFTAEKDAGETFFKKPNQKGFDFYSMHFHLRDYTSWMKDFVLGDYTISMGQGLLLHNGFGAGKSSEVLNIKKGGRIINAYSSINENRFYRGAAATISLQKNLEVTAFSSYNQADGNILEADTIQGLDDPQRFSSFVEDGFHRTQREIEKKNTLNRLSMGSQIKYKGHNTRIGINSLFESFDKTLDRRQSPYNQFLFNGKSLFNVSMDYMHQQKNFHFFGEFAMSQQGGTAQIHGLLLSLDKTLDLAVSYRNYARNYQSLYSNSFGETSGANNEKAWYTGFELRPNENWSFQAYADLWRHNWLKFDKDAPSDGKEYLLKLEYYVKRKMTFYVQYKYETKARNDRIASSSLDILGMKQLQRFRAQLNYKINSTLELRNRLEFSSYRFSDNSYQGVLAFQDILYKPLSSPFSSVFRFAIFSVDDYNARIYAYENDLLYEYSIPFYQNKGFRYYINLRYNINRMFTGELRWSQTHYSNVDEIGSGNEQISGSHRSELKAQIRIRF